MKSQIWSPDQIREQGEFVRFRAADVRTLPQFSEAVAQKASAWSGEVSQSTGEHFRMAGEYWDGLMNDPMFRERFDALVEKEVRSRLLKRLEHHETEVLPEISKEAMKQGYQEGKNLAHEQLEEEINKIEQNLTYTWQEKVGELEKSKTEASALLDSLVAEWKNQRESLLHSHEREWCQAMLHLMKRFQMEKSESYGKALEIWMAEAIPEFVTKSPVTVCVPDYEWEKYADCLGKKESEGKWHLVRDSKLMPGQIRFEAGAGGAIFDSGNNYQKLVDWLETIR